MRLGVKEALIDGRVVRGDISIRDGRIEEVGLSTSNGVGLAVPGFVDVQINGFDGIDFTDATTEDYHHVAQKLAATGVTAFQPTLITLPAREYLSPLEGLRPEAITEARILGMHLEGPFLSPIRRGAHNSDHMIEPDLDLVKRLLSTGHLTHMTVAPELPGALQLIDMLVNHGVIVSLGHTDADAATSHAAFDRGASSVTHIFGAQRPWEHRDPGVSGVGLVRGDVFITCIVDGIHLSPETVQLAAIAADWRFVLITDAISAAGRPDGRYVLGDRTVILKNGACRLEDGTLAGSALTMDQAVRNMIDLGFDPLVAIGAATAAPAALMRRQDLGSLVPGSAADVCVLDDRFRVMRTICRGSESFAA